MQAPQAPRTNALKRSPVPVTMTLQRPMWRYGVACKLLRPILIHLTSALDSVHQNASTGVSNPLDRFARHRLFDPLLLTCVDRFLHIPMRTWNANMLVRNIACDSMRNELFFLTHTAVHVFNWNGEWLRCLMPVSVSCPRGFVIDSRRGLLIIVDADSPCISVYQTSNGLFVRKLQPFEIPIAACVHPDTGWVYVGDAKTHDIRVFDDVGMSLFRFAWSSMKFLPNSMCIHPHSNRLLVVDGDSKSLVMFHADDGTCCRVYTPKHHDWNVLVHPLTTHTFLSHLWHPWLCVADLESNRSETLLEAASVHGTGAAYVMCVHDRTGRMAVVRRFDQFITFVYWNIDVVPDTLVGRRPCTCLHTAVLA